MIQVASSAAAQFPLAVKTLLQQGLRLRDRHQAGSLSAHGLVGHLVLYLCGYRDSERQQFSDYTCTALQLANFWQDVSADFAKGRIYLPLEDLRRFGVREAVIRDGENTSAFCEMMRFEVERAREWFAQGMPLIGKVGRALATDIELFSRGGQEILNAIERQDFAVLGRRPAISKARKLALVARAAAGKLLGPREKER